MADLAAGEHPLRIQAQYIKDLSFENPNAPKVYALLAESPPEVSVSIDVTAEHLEKRAYEVVLNLRVGANAAGKPAFLVELHYAALVLVHEAIGEADIDQLLHREAARFLFPFARSILADVTRDGGFPPLVVNPIDFDFLYRRKASAAAQQAAADAADSAPGTKPGPAPATNGAKADP